MWLLKGIYNIFELIYKEGEKEWLDEGKYVEALDELYEKLNNNEIDESQYEKEEESILELLGEIRQYKKEHNIGGDEDG